MEAIYWTMANGNKINVDDMDEKHLRNTLKLILRSLKVKPKKQEPKHYSGLRGDIAQDHFDTMMDMEYANDMDYFQGL
jgi:hypothetical protein